MCCALAAVRQRAARKCAAGCITNARRAAGPKRYGPTNDGVHASFHKSRCGAHAAAQSFTLCANQLGTRTNNALPLRRYTHILGRSIYTHAAGKNSLAIYIFDLSFRWSKLFLKALSSLPVLWQYTAKC